MASGQRRHELPCLLAPVDSMYPDQDNKYLVLEKTFPMVRLTRIAVVLCWLLTSGSAFATNYYIDYSSGNDSNNGTSKTSPWQHLPGMPGCQAQCTAASPKPADQFILKGGVTWPNSSLGWEWTWSGSAGNLIYIGVDQTWYAGSSWTRPIFN